MRQEAKPSSGQDAFSETVLDGVRYASLETPEKLWRLGSLTPHWREELPLLGADPGPEALAKLNSKDIFLNSGESPRLCVMCCGLGSAWPGMGRELYDNFPAARKAMDSLAAFVSWDLLSVMDETDPERLNHSRIQIPYLFMLEHAQWSLLASLGLRPDLICGHSLGELTALCLSGAYPLEAAWHLFETRSAHMSLLEENPGHESGMLAVSTGWDIIQEMLKEYPELYISNRNTSRQYILSGPRAILLELRKSLRRRRIPAFMLGINLAFHNPAMRVLRDLSLRRLNGLEMRPPQIPVISCVTAGPYPQTQPEICEYIADLDENTVDWPKCVRAIRERHGISHFLELGPQETLRGLVTEIDPGAECFSASRKGQETRAMRGLLARLYSLGLLKDKNIGRLANQKVNYPKIIPAKPAALQAPGAGARKTAPEWTMALELLAEETGRPIEELSPELDLRYDLALRSSRFPYLVQEAERRFNRQIALENLLQISTAGDLANFLSGSGEPSRNPGSDSPQTLPFERPSQFIVPPLAAFKLSSKKASGLEAWRPDPDKAGLARKLAGPIALCVLDEVLMPRIWAGMAPFGLKLLIPSFLLDKCSFLEKSGNELLPLNLERGGAPGMVLKALNEACAEVGPLNGVFYALPPLTGDELLSASKNRLSILPQILAANPGAWLCCLQRHAGLPEINKSGGPGDIENILGRAEEFFSFIRSLFNDNAVPPGLTRLIYWEDQRTNPELQNQNEAGDMLARSLLYDSPKELVWLSAAADPALSQSPVYCPSADCMSLIQSRNSLDTAPRLALFLGEGQYSSFREPALKFHGAADLADFPLLGQDSAPFIPLGHILKTMLAASRLACPWLVPFAAADIQIEALPLLPYGIVREYNVEAQAGEWLLQEKKLVRMCHASMSMRELSSNGRRTRSWAPLCKAVCSLAPPMENMARYHSSAFPEGPWTPLPDRLLNNFYDAAKLGEEWRHLRKIWILDRASRDILPIYYKGEISPMPRRIAGTTEWEYDAFAFLADAIYQALTIGLALSDYPAQSGVLSGLQPWRCRRVGFMRFVNALEDYPDGLRVEFKRSWNDSCFTRFDGAVLASSGKTILSFLHFEFDRA